MTASLALRPTLYEETVPGGGHTSFVLKRGQLLRITDIEGGANVSLLLVLSCGPSPSTALWRTAACTGSEGPLSTLPDEACVSHTCGKRCRVRPGLCK